MGGMKFPVASMQSEGLRTAVSDNLEKYTKQYLGEGVSDTLKSLKEEKTATLMRQQVLDYKRYKPS